MRPHTRPAPDPSPYPQHNTPPLTRGRSLGHGRECSQEKSAKNLAILPSPHRCLQALSPTGAAAGIVANALKTADLKAIAALPFRLLEVDLRDLLLKWKENLAELVIDTLQGLTGDQLGLGEWNPCEGKYEWCCRGWGWLCRLSYEHAAGPDR